ncbi:MAG TPA: tRNA lysidine(34) synthetase TilS [Gemmatimonadaceae bacterium]|nr:tRNA lysidine(34) synthetase TilS [Gemmatimonadaceae bacterium]
MAKSQGALQATRAHDLVTIVSRSLPRRGSAVLAISGGIDSMCLLDAAARVREGTSCDLVVATFDHSSGAHSSRAAAFVARAASRFRLPAVIGRATESARSESAWREARWNFLRSVSERVGGPVLTAHNRDDQIETVLMRALRGAGARGLAGLRAPTAVRRPFLAVSRDDLRAYASEHAVQWIEDPTNQSLAYLRNRVRVEILPALLQLRPRLGDELIAVGERAAAWRIELATMVDSAVQHTLRRDERGLASLQARLADLRAFSQDALRIVWPELASRLGVTLDWRGTLRATQLTLEGRTGARVQLSGGWELSRSRESIELRAMGRPSDAATPMKLMPPMTWSAWRFTALASPRSKGAEYDDSARDSWRADLPGDADLQIRQWRPGDRMSIRRGNQLARRKVKYLLSDARISGHIRASWPVVLAGDEILWIPGVRRSDAATARSGGPVVTYVCDYLDRRP